MSTIVELAKEVERKKAEYDRAQERLLAALNGSLAGVSRLAPRTVEPGTRRPLRGPGSQSIAQRVLDSITASASGKARGELIAELGRDHEAAIHSALKKHQERGSIESRDGRWVQRTTATPTKKKGPRQ